MPRKRRRIKQGDESLSKGCKAGWSLQLEGPFKVDCQSENDSHHIWQQKNTRQAMHQIMHFALLGSESMLNMIAIIILNQEKWKLFL